MLIVHKFSLETESKPLIENLTFEAEKGEILSIMGPSGIGKSSLLAYISGSLPKELSAKGDIRLDGVRLNDIAPHKRNVGLMQQSPLLFPHMTIHENLLFAVPHHYSRRERKRKVLEAIKDLQLDEQEDKLPDALSGGQQARVALLRTLLAEPQCLLIDEPFSKLDVALRQTARAFVIEKIKQANIPAVLVTHDEEDARAMAGGIIKLATLS